MYACISCTNYETCLITNARYCQNFRGGSLRQVEAVDVGDVA